MGPTGIDPVAEHLAAVHGRRGATTVVGLGGGVSVGKSTFAAMIAESLAGGFGLTTTVVSADGFLHPNARLAEMGLLQRKGFPETYDDLAVLDFLDRVHAGARTTVPVYDHHLYDISDAVMEVDPVDIVVLEGLHVLGYHPRLELGIYLDAAEPDLRRWFVRRAFEMRDAARTTYSPFFDAWKDAPDGEFEAMAIGAWELVNLPNLVEFVEPTRRTADVVVTKGPDHTIVSVEIRTTGEEPDGRG